MIGLATVLSLAEDKRKRRQGEGSETVPFVEDLVEKEPRRRRRPLSREHRSRGQHVPDLSGRETAPSRLDHDTDDATDHLPEEMGAGDPKDDQVAPGKEFRPAKSWNPRNVSAAARIRPMSSSSFTHQTYRFPKAVRTREIR
jgi:hypothetical protein